MSKNYDWRNAPTECFCAQRKSGTIAIEAELSATNQGENEHPLALYGHFSRFKVSVLGNGSSVMANIPVRELPNILSKTAFAEQKHYEMELDKATTPTPETANLSPAYTVRFINGRGGIKGLTAVEVLLNVPDGGEKLHKHRDWLQENLKQYPKNQLYIDAIMDAGRLVKAGELDKSKVTAQHPLDGKEFILYKADTRPLPRTDSTGKLNFCYEISIVWRLGQDNPVTVTVENYYAPVVTTQDGRKNVTKSQKKDSKRSSFSMTTSEWAYACRIMQANMGNFEAGVYKSALRAAVDASKANRETYEQSQTAEG
jgi:hypothetical protein